MNFKPWNMIQGIPSLSNPPKSLPKGGNNMGSKKKATTGKVTKNKASVKTFNSGKQLSGAKLNLGGGSKKKK